MLLTGVLARVKTIHAVTVTESEHLLASQSIVMICSHSFTTAHDFERNDSARKKEVRCWFRDITHFGRRFRVFFSLVCPLSGKYSAAILDFVQIIAFTLICKVTYNVRM